MDAVVNKVFRSQTTLSSILFLIIIWLLAIIKWPDFIDASIRVGQAVVVFATVVAGLKAYLPDAVTVPPNSVTITPKAGDKVLAAVQEAADAEQAEAAIPHVTAPVVVVSGPQA